MFNCVTRPCQYVTRSLFDGGGGGATGKFRYKTLTTVEDGEEDDSKRSDAASALDPWRLSNICIPASYFCVGLGMTFIGTPLTYYCVDVLDASAAQQSVISTVMSLPWSFKLAFGFLSDSLPIAGQRRKPYFVIGWAVYTACNFLLALMGEPSVKAIVALMFLQTTGYMASDVMTDTLVVERSKAFESTTERGSFQATGYTVRTFGTVVGSIMGATLYNQAEWGWGLSISQLFMINGLFPALILLPLCPFLRETATQPPRPLREQWADIFAVLKLRAVWQPCSFVFGYNAFQISNPAWSNFLILGLGFTDWNLGVLTIFAAVFSWFGIVVYKRVFFHSSWRMIYLYTTALSAFFSILQISLIFGVNEALGIPNLAFAIGDDAVWAFVLYIQFLPMCQMYIAMCPDGSEGGTYAMLTTLSNMAGTLAYDISTQLTGIWDVSNSAIEAHDYAGMWKLTLLTSLVQVLPLPFLFLIPASKTEQLALQKNPDSNWWGGAVFVAVLAVSLAVTVVESIAVIY